jgi:FkbM family methyltransferase
MMIARRARAVRTRIADMVASFRAPSKVLRRLKLAPLAARKLKDWPRFMYNYALGLVPNEPYVFRSGAQLQIGRGVDHVPIIEVFLREEYGRIADGATILDLGANIGTFSVYAASSARDVRIWAYEPLADFHALLAKNVEINRLGSAIRCFNCAVGADTGRRQLVVENAAFSFPTLLAAEGVRAGRRVEVECAALIEILDSNDLKHVDLVKMDCEGSEYEILYGAPDTCFERIREIRMEYHNLPAERCNVRDLMAFLQERNYTITMVNADAASRPSGNLWARKHA